MVKHCTGVVASSVAWHKKKDLDPQTRDLILRLTADLGPSNSNPLKFADISCAPDLESSVIVSSSQSCMRRASHSLLEPS